jgi:hypothetical protein
VLTQNQAKLLERQRCCVPDFMYQNPESARGKGFDTKHFVPVSLDSPPSGSSG